MKPPNETREWLLKSDFPHVRYQAKSLFCPNEADESVLAEDAFIQTNLAFLDNWESIVLRRHDKADLPIHRFALLADLGITVVSEKRIEDLIREKIMKYTDERGIPLIQIEIPKAFGGTGIPGWDWTICDFPIVVYGCLKMGYRSETMEKALRTLEGMVAEDGCHCMSSVPKFHGPGPKTSICPYASLLVARALAVIPETRAGEAARRSVDALLHHWEYRKEKKYFLFGIGTDFAKLKFPFIWYNLLHMLEVVSQYPQFQNDPRVKEMAEILLARTDETLRFKPESVHTVYKGQDFAQKKEYSPTLTVFALRILMRLGYVDSGYIS